MYYTNIFECTPVNKTNVNKITLWLEQRVIAMVSTYLINN